MADIDNSISNDDKNIAVISHLGGSVFSVFPSLIIWWLKRDDSAFIGEHAREALNFQITVLIVSFISSVLVVILVGFVLLGFIWLANVIFCLIAAVAASKGEHYQYPFSLRLIN